MDKKVMIELKRFLNPSFWSKAILVAAVTFFAACSDDDPSYGSLDSDGDGVANGADAFPTNAAESADADGDGIGDNADNCVDTANGAQTDTDGDTVGDACDSSNAPDTYGDFASSFIKGESSISYTGQVARQMLILGLVNTMTSVTEGTDVTTVTNAMHDWVDGPTEDLSLAFYTTKGGEPVLNAATVSAISSGKNLDGKIAGGDGDGGGETSKLINDEFFGWSEGLAASATPIDLVDYMIGKLATEVSDGTSVTVSTVAGDTVVSVSDYQTDAYGRNWRQLIQKFLLGAVTLSQATNDYLQQDFANMLDQEKGTKAYGTGEHDWDEAFGYFGAARNGNEFTDDEAVGKTPGTGFPEARDAYKNGYNDANADGSIDPRSEVFLGISQNCAKRDRLDIDGDGVGETNMSKEAFDAFVLGRHVIAEATAAQSMSAAQEAIVKAQAEIAGMAMEKCVAATVIHYINDIIADIGNFSDGKFADTSNFNNYTKHWGEMKGFALGLQFSPWSPFASGEGRSNLKLILSRMGDAPVMPDGTQAGIAYSGGTAGYISMMQGNRTLLQDAYGFDEAVAAAW
tara:strand:+ start:309 stop:2024 length:1716 start_codon:yes stop_codon:yes gene_type:complete